MGFDVQKFQGASFKDRTAEVPVEDLKGFFGDKDKAIWTVRGLTGEELAFARDAEERARSVNALVEGLAGKGAGAKVKVIKDELGLSDDKAPADYIRRLEILKYGSVDPEIDKPTSVKLAANYPTTFYLLTNKILELTGLGRLGELSGSGTTKK
jgi:hypothetical protein